MIVVSDTSPIFYLVQLNHFWLLEALFKEVLIPPTVEQELRAAEDDAVNNAISEPWVRVVPFQDTYLFNQLLGDLDRGECEAIVLALEQQADILLIDELKGRSIATGLQLNISGLGGVLLLAKVKGLIPLVKPLLEELHKSTFRLSRKTVQDILQKANEL